MVKAELILGERQVTIGPMRVSPNLLVLAPADPTGFPERVRGGRQKWRGWNGSGPSTYSVQ